MNAPYMRFLLAVPLAALLAVTAGHAQRVPQRPEANPPGGRVGGGGGGGGFVPRFEAVAETRLLMEGLMQANYRSLNRNLKAAPGDAQTWGFARGQALLIAETGNLLMLRPPRNNGRDSWMKQATDLREKATDLARQLGAKDFAQSRAALMSLTESCNRCHQTFRVPVTVTPDPPAQERDA